MAMIKNIRVKFLSVCKRVNYHFTELSVGKKIKMKNVIAYPDDIIAHSELNSFLRYNVD